MMKKLLPIVALSISAQSLFAGGLIPDLGKKVESYVQGRVEANKNVPHRVEDFFEKTEKDAEGLLHKTGPAVEAGYKHGLEEAKKLHEQIVGSKKAPYKSTLEDKAKKAGAGEDAFDDVNVDFLDWVWDPETTLSLNDVVDRFDAIIKKNNLGRADLEWVSNEDNLNPLHILVQAVFSIEQNYVAAAEKYAIDSIAHPDAPAPVLGKNYALGVAMIAHLSLDTKLPTLPDGEGNTAIQWVANQKPRSVPLLRALATSEYARKQFEQILENEKK